MKDKKKDFNYAYHFWYRPISYAIWGLILCGLLEIFDVRNFLPVECCMMLGGVIGLLVGIYHYSEPE